MPIFIVLYCPASIEGTVARRNSPPATFLLCPPVREFREIDHSPRFHDIERLRFPSCPVLALFSLTKHRESIANRHSRSATPISNLKLHRDSDKKGRENERSFVRKVTVRCESHAVLAVRRTLWREIIKHRTHLVR